MTPRYGRGEPPPDESLLTAVVDVLSGTLGLRDGSTGDHAGRVADMAQRIGQKLGLEQRELRDLAYAARLHDIGKVGVPDAVLYKTGPLEPDERELVQHHSVSGAALIGWIPGLESVARIVRHHHENYDGSGYPDGLSGRDIPLSSRILSVADAYAAMSEDRPYRRARPRFEVDREFADRTGTQFDPYVVAALREVVSS